MASSGRGSSGGRSVACGDEPGQQGWGPAINPDEGSTLAFAEAQAQNARSAARGHDRRLARSREIVGRVGPRRDRRAYLYPTPNRRHRLRSPRSLGALRAGAWFAVLAMVSVLGTWPPAIHHHSG